MSLYTFLLSFFLMTRLPPIPTLFPYTTLFRSDPIVRILVHEIVDQVRADEPCASSNQNSSHSESVRCKSVIDSSLRLRRSEEHTSELQSPDHLVCRLLLEKKKKKNENDQG